MSSSDDGNISDDSSLGLSNIRASISNNNARNNNVENGDNAPPAAVLAVPRDNATASIGGGGGRPRDVGGGRDGGRGAGRGGGGRGAGRAGGRGSVDRGGRKKRGGTEIDFADIASFPSKPNYVRPARRGLPNPKALPQLADTNGSLSLLKAPIFPKKTSQVEKIEKLNKRINDLTAHINTLQGAIVNDYKELNDAVQAHHDDLESLQNILETLEKYNNQLESYARQKESHAQVMQVQNGFLQRSLAEKDTNHKSQTKTYDALISNLKLQLKEKENMIQNLQAKDLVEHRAEVGIKAAKQKKQNDFQLKRDENKKKSDEKKRNLKEVTKQHQRFSKTDGSWELTSDFSSRHRRRHKTNKHRKSRRDSRHSTHRRHRSSSSSVSDRGSVESFSNSSSSSSRSRRYSRSRKDSRTSSRHGSMRSRGNHASSRRSESIDTSTIGSMTLPVDIDVVPAAGNPNCEPQQLYDHDAILNGALLRIGGNE